MRKVCGKRGRPKTAHPKSAAERMRAYRKRKRDAGLVEVRRWVPEKDAAAAGNSDHRLLDACSLAMHCLIARRIAEEPALIEQAKRNLARWRAIYGDRPPRHIKEWQSCLDRPLSEVLNVITDMSDEAARLRSSSPFTGILSPEERQRIYAAFGS